MKENSFDSALSPYIQGFLDQKRALGFKYITEEYILRSFDRYWCEKNGRMAVITQESLEGWRKRRETEGITSQSIRISTVRQLSLYMNSIGIESFVPTDKYVKTHPAIHILSLSEISELFQIIDSWHPKRPCQGTSRMAEEYRVLFRLILSTGLRRQEAVEIRISDIEWDSMSITVRGAKGRKDRLVYMAEDMSALVRTYMQYICRVTGYIPEWLFPSIDINEHVSGGGLSGRFRKFWEMTSFAGTCEKPPTIHALRHTYVVLRMNKWMEEGEDLQVMLPYLSRQLGHTSTNETFYYYHQVLDAFRIIRQKDTLASRVIPEVRKR